jgi:hypothetical protein
MSVGSEVRWRAITTDGKQIVFIASDGHEWRSPDLICETELAAEGIVREIKEFAKDTYQNAEFNRLCRAGD